MSPAPTRNEIASAELCDTYALALGFDETTRAEARAAILATTHDAEPPTECARLVVDADLSILGASREKYESFARAIRAEWSHVSESDFRSGRTAILAKFLERPSIYSTPEAIALFEQPARDNIAHELASLIR